jgi:hypothetical protein
MALMVTSVVLVVIEDTSIKSGYNSTGAISVRPADTIVPTRTLDPDAKVP